MPSAARTLRWLSHPAFRWGAGIIAAVIVSLGIFDALDFPVFSLIGMPHEFCYLRDPRLIGLHVASDLLIGLGYVSISGTLAYLVYKASKSIPFNWVFLAFGLFIISCGFTHFMEVWVIWQPVYWLSGYVKVVTAAASVATALALFPLLPRIFRLIESARQSEERRAEIERLNEDLARFNYSVAHDLRSPLRGISAYSQALREDFGAEFPPGAVNYLQRMQVSIERMDALIADLLAYAKLGRQEIQLRPVPLGEPLRAALDLLDAEITRTSAVVQVVESLPVVRGDPTLLQVVFQNLIGNAIKFVSPGTAPRIQVAATVTDGQVNVTVTDNGVGFPPEARDKVFGLFQRFHPSHAGTGIGLALVQRAMERLQGTIDFEPAPADTGTRFVLRFPAA